jgi:hypothetical protein
LRASTSANAVSASSSATSSRSRSGEIVSASSERYQRSAAAALLIVPRARRVDEDAPHQAGGDGEEVRAIAELDLLAVDQPDEDFVDQRGRLQRMAWALAVHLPLRQFAELTVYERDQRVQCVSITAAPGLEQSGGGGRLIGRHSSALGARSN